MTANRRRGALLRVLATTDLHGAVLPWDYASDAAAPARGLAVMTALARARSAGADAVLRVDCGDAFQGGAFDGARGVAVVDAMSAAGIEAMALGNHDLDFGAAVLERLRRRARFPILSANVALPGLRPWCILRRDAGGPLRIGLVGLTAPRLAAGGPEAGPGGGVLVEAVARAVAEVRLASADVVIVLSHSGPGTCPPSPGTADVSAAVAALEGVDAVVGGHVHTASAASEDGTPLIVPGAYGTALGEIDLWIADGRVVSTEGRLHRPGPELRPDPAVAGVMERPHRMTRRRLARSVGRTATGLDARLSFARPTTAFAAIAAARADAVRATLADGPHAGLPVIGMATARPPSAPSPFVPPGPLMRRELEALCPYHDAQRGVLVTGALLRDWLERGASIYARIELGQDDVPLLDPRVPAWFLDLPHGGISWSVDLSAGALYGPDGTPQDGPGRVRHLRLHGRPVEEAEPLVVATSDFRLLGHGPFAGFFDGMETVAADPRAMRRLLPLWLKRGGHAPAAAFSFVPIRGAGALVPAPDGPVPGFGAAGPGRARLSLDLQRAAPSPISAARG